MRLIDADKLEYSFVSDDDGDGDFPVVEEDDIINAPTVEAIPVEWLEDKELEYRTTGDKLMSDAFAVVIEDWKKEQKEREPDDGKT